MNIPSPAPNDPRMARLTEAIEQGHVAVTDFRSAMRLVNDSALQAQATPVIEAAELVFKQHAVQPSPTIANDTANLLAAFNQLNLPGNDVDFGPLPGLKALRGARGNIREEFSQILLAARALGWQPSEPALPDIGNTEVPRVGLEGMLKALIARMEVVEQLLDLAVEPEGESTAGRTAIQIALVNVFVRNMRVELALAKLEARVKSIIDLSALGRAIENVTELTADFVATVRGIATKMTTVLREASEQLPPRVREIAGGFRTIVRRVASVYNSKRGPEPVEAPTFESNLPPNIDLAEVHRMILLGQTLPPSWRPLVKQLNFSGRGSRDLKDLTPLANLTALRRLDLRNTQVSDLSSIAGLAALKELDLRNTQVQDLAPLAGLTALRRLYLRNTQVGDLAPLVGLTALQTLHLRNTQISDLAPLAGLTALRGLDLNSTKVRDLAPLAGLAALQRLDLRNTQIVSLTSLAGLTTLQWLDLRNTHVGDLAPLADLTALQDLHLTGTQVGDLAPLAGLDALQRLYVGDTQVDDLEPLAGLTALQELHVNGAPVGDLKPLAQIKTLRTLYLRSTKVGDLEPLAGLTSLQILDIRNTKVSSLALLANLESLRWISVESVDRRKALAETLGRRGSIVHVRGPD